jgi:hypothetical protein
MESVDLLYSGLMVTAGILSVGAGVLLTAAVVSLVPLPRKAQPSAATISSRGSGVSRRGFPLRRLAPSDVPSNHVSPSHGSEKSSSTRSLPEALSQRTLLGRPVRLIQ